MDSAEAKLPSASTATATSPASSPIQDSPFSNYISSLSPINPVRALHVVQGCLALNSPPLVFTTPHVNTNRKAHFLERIQPSSNDTVQGSDGDNKKDDGTTCCGGMDSSVIQYQESLITDTKDDGSGNSLQVQTSGSSGSVVGYLVGPAEPDFVNSADSACINSKLSVQLLESLVEDSTGSKKTVLEFHEKNVIGSAAGGIILSLSTKVNEEFDKKPSSTEKIGEEQHATERPCCECPELESDPIESDFMEQQFQNSDVQKMGNDHRDRFEGSPQQHDSSLQAVQMNEVPAENIEATLNGPSDLEVSRNQRVVSRRCLQFGEAQADAKTNGSNVSILSNDVLLSSSLSKMPGIENLDSNCVDSSANSQKTELVDVSQPSATLLIKNCSEKSSLTFSKPSGIGLHLNSIISAIPVACHGTANPKLVVQETDSAPARSTHSQGSMKSHLQAIDEILPSLEDGTLETRALTFAGGNFESSSGGEQMEHHATPYAKWKIMLEQPDDHKEYNQQSVKKKRKKSSSTIDGDGCKRCNCKRTKCLKLYCDCFAAGIYCAEPCTCQGCFNRPEYKDRVLETRQQIESRNPLAFAPKIIQHNAKSLVNGREDGLTTPSTARHQRGCNCKRSMCLKKYCECFQANVGCSNGCRCEGCKNVYGMREGYRPSEQLMSSTLNDEGTFDGKLEMVATKEDYLPLESNPNYYTPLTPSFPCSDNERNASETSFLSRCPPSPESELTILSSYAKSSRDSENNDRLLESSKDESAEVCYSQGMDHNNANTYADICHLSPVSNCPSVSMASASSKASGFSNVAQLRFCPRSGCLSGRSFRWQSSHSPLTPVSRLDGTKNFQEPGSDGGSCCILEDDTPELLTDASIPSKPVKVSSPNGKRVSPPHTGRELVSSSSGPLRSGRKFILKAVPSFPPLTPCVELKGGADQDSSVQDTDCIN